MADPATEMERFRDRAKELLNDLPLLRHWLELRKQLEDCDRRAFIIEFAGMPKAGKSSAIEHLRHFFSHGYKVKVKGEPSYINASQHRYEVYTPAEGVSLRTPGYLKSNKIDYNTWAGAYGVQELLQASHDTHNDLVILDRGPWDAGCWLEYWKQEISRESTSETHVAAIAAFFQLDHWTTRSDMHIVLVVDPDEAAQREQTSRLIQHGGFASHTDGMRKMHEVYKRRFDELNATKNHHCPHVGEVSSILLDTTKVKPQEVTLRIIERAYAVLSGKINEHAEAVVITVDEVTQTMQSYFSTKKAIRGKDIEFLPAFLQEANKLSPVQKLQLKQLIHERRAPPDLNLAADARVGRERANPFELQLRELLREVQNR